MRAAQHGDRQATEMLLRRHAERWFRLCRGLMGNDADAQDAAQNGSIAVIRGLAKFDGQSQFSTWSYRVVTNACLDELRRRGRFTARHELLGDGSTAKFDAALTTSGMRHDSVSDLVDQLVISAALTAVPEDFRTAIILRDVCDLDYAEIARVLNIPPGTVRSRIARGRSALAAAISGNQTHPRRRPTAE